MRTKIIVLPDSHSKPFWHKKKNPDGNWNSFLIEKHIANRRYTWLSQFILETLKALEDDEELVIVDLGDFADLKSLSSYDKGKAEAELERLELDIDYSRDARQRLMQPVMDYIQELKDGHRKRARPIRWVSLLGNHEYRWSRFRADNPAWVDFEALPDDITLASQFGAQVVPFLIPIEISGIHFCHYYYKKDSRYAIGGVTPARSILMFLKKSSVSGHTHERDTFGQTTIVGTIRAVVGGCYYEHDERYPGPQGHANISRGLFVLNNCKDGNFNEVWFPLEEIKKKYWDESQGAYEWKDVIADVVTNEPLGVDLVL